MIRIVLIATVCLFLVLSSAVFAIIAPGQIPTSGDLGIGSVLKNESKEGIQGVIETIVQWIYYIFLIVAVMFILFAAYTYLMAQGDPEGVNKARTQIMYAVIAIVVALMAVSVEFIVRDLINNRGTGGSGSGECSVDRAEELRTGKRLCPQYLPQQSYNFRVKPF